MEHFNSIGHKLAYMKITVLEKMKYEGDFYRLEREHYFIRKLNTYHKGRDKQK